MIRANGQIVEIHWAILPRFFSLHLDSSDIWGGLTAESIQGRRLRLLTPETLLPILCVHGAKHQWQRLQWLCDVSILTERLTNWESAFQFAQRIGARRMLMFGVDLARDLLGTSLPEEAREAVRADGAVAGLVRTARTRLCDGPEETAESLQTHRFRLAVRENLSDRIRYLLRGFFQPSPRDRELVGLPHTLRFLYPGVKAVRHGMQVTSELMAACMRHS